MSARPAPVLPALDEPRLIDKEARVRRALAGFGSVIVAFSGGTDSASYPARHREIALRLARDFRLRHEFIVTSEMDDPNYRANQPDRCYYCKQELFTKLTALARERGIAAVLDGANADDRGDYRPGRKAARQMGVRSPLDEADLSKDEIRELSRQAGLPTWDQPASACLSSRIPYHSEVTAEKLAMIERAEGALSDLGFCVYRVRHHDDLARVEVGPDEMGRALDPAVREALVRDLKAIGYRFVTLDLQGYRMGSLNEGLSLKPV